MYFHSLNIVQKNRNRLNITPFVLPVNKILEYRSNFSCFRKSTTQIHHQYDIDSSKEKDYIESKILK